MFRRREREVVAMASLAAQFTAHQAECIRDKAEIRQSLAAQDAERKRMHAENNLKFDKINRIIWIATGIFAALQFLASHDGLAEKILKLL